MDQAFQTPEIIENILLSLDYQDLFVARGVSRLFQHTLQNSKPLKRAMLLDSDDTEAANHKFHTNELLGSDLFQPLSFRISANDTGTELWIAVFARPLFEWSALMVDGVLPISAEASWREARLSSKQLAKVSVTMHDDRLGMDLHTDRSWGGQGVALFKGETLGDLVDWYVRASKRLWRS